MRLPPYFVGGGVSAAAVALAAALAGGGCKATTEPTPDPGEGGEGGDQGAAGGQGGAADVDAAAAGGEGGDPGPIELADAGVTTDATPPMVGVFGAPKCANSGFLLCEDFENGIVNQSPDPTRWGKTGLAVVSDYHAARGTKSVMVQSAPLGSAGIQMNKIFPIKNNTFYGRMFFLQDPPFDTRVEVHWDWVQAVGTVPNSGGRRPWVRYGGVSGRWLANYYWGGEYGQGSVERTPAYPVQWHCLEWYYRGDWALDPVNGKNEMRLWIDDKEITDVHVTNPQWQMPVFEMLQLGYNGSQSYRMYRYIRMWIDEVAVHSEKIGCDR